MEADGSDALVVGVDFGTLSGRALVVRVSDGAELGSAVHTYSHGVVDEVLPSTGARLPPDWALQVPGDYVDVLRNAVPAAIEAAGVDPADVIGIGTDFTACTIVPVRSDGIPLCELADFAGRPHAYVKLWKHGLVVWTAGTISARVPGHDLLVIKPSGVSYDELTPNAIVITDLDANLVDGDRTPSSDTAAHAYVYKHLPWVGGQAHTHSPWAARGEPIPCVLTMMADEFGGQIPIGPFALIGDDSIGRGIVDTLTLHRSKAVLMQSHGVFTVGASARDAVKAAVLCEEVARTVHFARQLGNPLPISQTDIDSLYDRYQHAYGQKQGTP